MKVTTLALLLCMITTPLFARKSPVKRFENMKIKSTKDSLNYCIGVVFSEMYKEMFKEVITEVSDEESLKYFMAGFVDNQSAKGAQLDTLTIEKLTDHMADILANSEEQEQPHAEISSQDEYKSALDIEAELDEEN